MTTAAPVVELLGVSRSFPGPPEVHAVRGIDLRLHHGDYLSIVGPSGSGKSTLLHLLGLLDRPTAGTYLLDGVDTTTLTERQRAGLRGTRIGFVFQAFHLLGHRTVLENVLLALLYTAPADCRPAGPDLDDGGRGRRRVRRERTERAVAALERVGLGHRLTFTPATLSGGERQRVAIARALVNEPSVLLADEPTGNLDTVTSGRVLDLFDELHASGLTLAVITHDEQVSGRAARRVRIVDGLLSDVA